MSIFKIKIEEYIKYESGQYPNAAPFQTAFNCYSAPAMVGYIKVNVKNYYYYYPEKNPESEFTKQLLTCFLWK